MLYSITSFAKSMATLYLLVLDQFIAVYTSEGSKTQDIHQNWIPG